MSPSPFSHGAQPPPLLRPSPSLSPSISLLLSTAADEPAQAFDAGDYFSPSSAPTGLPDEAPLGAGSASASEVFGSARGSPTPTGAGGSTAGGSGPFSNLLAPDPAFSTPSNGPAPSSVSAEGSASSSRPRSSHKRPRPTSSGSHTSFTSNGAGGGAVDEEEGAMEPPTSRVRRSSSISSNPPPPSAPSTSAAHSHPSPAGSQRQPPPPPPAAAPPMQRRPSEQPLEPSIFNIEPIDEFTREVADWLWGFCAGLDWDKVEIEAKIGLLVDSRGGTRVHLPVPIETILTETDGLRFQSNMTVNQHKAFNRLLNSRVEESASPNYPFATVRYAHTREIDTFHNASSGKVRVTTDQKDRSKVKAVEKIRVADMNIFSPKRMFDWRVSVSLENPAPIPDAPPTHTRFKDRISYTHQLFTVDLTQVTSSVANSQNPNRPQAPQQPPTHELEIEFRNARTLLEEAAKEQRGEPSRYLEMVQGLLNNIRMLIRNASDP
ncbi:hypothetical protein JCM10213_001014 [Rhodosporidiobolus nylandii]